MKCLFCAIVAGDIPASKVKENSNVLAFNDINPQAPTHILIIPKAHYENAAELATVTKERDEALQTRMICGLCEAKIDAATKLGDDKKGEK